MRPDLAFEVWQEREPVTADIAGGRITGLLHRSVPIVLYADAWTHGGLTGYVANLGHGFVKRGYRVAALCEHSDAIETMTSGLRSCGVTIHTIPGGHRPTLRERLDRHRAIAGAVRAYPGCLLAMMMGWFAIGGSVILGGAAGGAGAIVRADLVGPEPPLGWRRRAALVLKDLPVDRIVVGAAENRHAYAELMGRDRGKIDVVHTGIDLSRFQPDTGRQRVRDRLRFGPNDLVVGTVSRLSDERKGLRLLMEMAGRVAHEHPSARFLLVGDGWLRGALEARAFELGIADRVTFTGWRTDVPDLLAAMDVFVMPSTHEGGPTSVLEAMAMAKPVVATAVGMVPEVVDPGATGFIVPPGDDVALAEGVGRLLADPGLRATLARGARERALRSFSVNMMVEGYLKVFARALAQRLGRKRT